VPAYQGSEWTNGWEQKATAKATLLVDDDDDDYCCRRYFVFARLTGQFWTIRPAKKKRKKRRRWRRRRRFTPSLTTAHKSRLVAVLWVRLGLGAEKGGWDVYLGCLIAQSGAIVAQAKREGAEAEQDTAVRAEQGVV
jgi:hypothetical protein